MFSNRCFFFVIGGIPCSVRLTTQGRTSLALTPEEEPLDITVSKNTPSTYVINYCKPLIHDSTFKIVGHWIALF